MKRFLPILMALIVLTGCGGSSVAHKDMAYVEEAMEAPMAMAMDAGAALTSNSTAASGALPENRKWIVTVNMAAETEDLESLLTSLDEQIKALLDINSADIGKARGNAAKVQEDLDAALATISELKANAEDSEKLKQRIAEFEQAEADRKEAEKKAAERAELEERFGAVSGEKKYIHDMVREGVLNDFGKALLDKANRGKSDAEIFDALTKDKGYFASENPPANMGGVGNIGGDDTSALSDAEYYAKLYESKK